MELACPLCAYRHCNGYFREPDSAKFARHYWQCGQCSLIFVDAAQRLSADQEKAVYDQHENHIDDPGYRKFLSRLFNPLCERLPAGAKGLDFGCGPGPALATMFVEAGFHISTYDPFYCLKPQVLEQHYDFITATEVAEHLFNPGDVFEKLWQQLNHGGMLGLMTKLARDKSAFSQWHYKNDPTHVCFFSETTFRWLAKHLGANIEFIGSDVILLTK